MRFKKKKSKRFRGSKTHGWGAKKKHRGAGNRGGRGMAGTGKRADQFKPTILNLYGNEYFGKHGFKRHNTKEQKGVNIAWLERYAERLAEKKLISKENSMFVVNLKKLGFDKLLSTGKTKKKFDITTNYASEKAVGKIEEAGGKVTVIMAEKELKKEE